MLVKAMYFVSASRNGKFHNRLIPVYIDTSQLQESIDFEASLAQGKMVMASGLLGDTSNRCWVVDDAHVLSPEVRHALLVEAKTSSNTTDTDHKP